MLVRLTKLAAPLAGAPRKHYAKHTRIGVVCPLVETFGYVFVKWCPDDIATASSLPLLSQASTSDFSF